MQQNTARVSLALVLGLIATGCGKDSAAPLNADGASSPSLGADRQGASEGDGHDDGRAFTIAVIGDTPYGGSKFAEFPSLVAAINADPKVELVAHVGDIKAGKNSPCTDSYSDSVRALFDTFDDPLVYTPGDNEWTDCHVAIKNNGLYTPTERLQEVRAKFFPVAGRTLGTHSRWVWSQAFELVGNKSDRAYVENVTWNRSRVVFATLNLPGSNNDLAPWGTPLPADAGNYQSQADEYATRTKADSVWLARTFLRARLTFAPAVVLIIQADMWDKTEPTLAGFDGFVTQLGTLAAQYGKPVLLLEGDSHVFNEAHPFSASSEFFGLHPNTPVAENVTRIVLEGSDKGRTEYLRLTIDPTVKGVSPFSYERVPLVP